MRATDSPATTTPALAAIGVSKDFGRTRVLDAVDFAVHPGEVHALVGENGAGKTTLLRILTGREHPTTGSLLLGGEVLAALTPTLVKARGVAVVPQHVELAEDLSVAENVFLNRWPTRRGLVDLGAMHQAARRVTERVGLRVDPAAVVRDLSYVEKQMLEIARLTEFEPRVVVLDEPTAALSVREIRVLFALIRRLRADGIAVVYVSHYLNEIASISDRVTVLREGRVVSSTRIAATTTERIVEDMVGPIADLYPERSLEPGGPVLEILGAAMGGIADLWLTVRRHEIVGIVGPKGEGLSDLLRTVCGVSGRLAAGSVLMHGRPVPPRSASAAVGSGLGYLSEERSRWGVLPGRSVAENITTSSLRDLTRFRVFLDLARERRTVAGILRTYLVRAPRPDSDILELSGGNQQKALLARLFGARLDAYVLDDPTLGVDVGSKAEINRLMNQQVVAGAAILLSTSDLPELLHMCDRVLVIRHGAVVLEAPRGTLSLDELEALLEGEQDV